MKLPFSDLRQNSVKMDGCEAQLSPLKVETKEEVLNRCNEYKKACGGNCNDDYYCLACNYLNENYEDMCEEAKNTPLLNHTPFGDHEDVFVIYLIDTCTGKYSGEVIRAANAIMSALGYPKYTKRFDRFRQRKENLLKAMKHDDLSSSSGKAVVKGAANTKKRKPKNRRKQVKKKQQSQRCVPAVIKECKREKSDELKEITLMPVENEQYRGSDPDSPKNEASLILPFANDCPSPATNTVSSSEVDNTAFDSLCEDEKPNQHPVDSQKQSANRVDQHVHETPYPPPLYFNERESLIGGGSQNCQQTDPYPYRQAYDENSLPFDFEINESGRFGVNEQPFGSSYGNGNELNVSVINTVDASFISDEGHSRGILPTPNTSIFV